MSRTGEVLGQARRSTIRQAVIGRFVAAMLWLASAVLVAMMVGIPLWGYMVYMLGFGWIVASLVWWGRYPSAYVEGFRDGQEAEHYFDDTSVANPLTGKPYGPGPLWAGSEPMDYPDPRCVCGALWLSDGTETGQCGRYVMGREELGEQATYLDINEHDVPLCGQIAPPDPYLRGRPAVVCTEPRETHIPGVHRGHTSVGDPYEWRERVT